MMTLLPETKNKNGRDHKRQLNIEDSALCEDTHAEPHPSLQLRAALHQLGLHEEEEEVSVQEKIRGQEPPLQVNKEAGGWGLGAGGAAAADLPVHKKKEEIRRAFRRRRRRRMRRRRRRSRSRRRRTESLLCELVCNKSIIKIKGSTMVRNRFEPLERFEPWEPWSDAQVPVLD